MENVVEANGSVTELRNARKIVRKKIDLRIQEAGC